MTEDGRSAVKTTGERGPVRRLAPVLAACLTVLGTAGCVSDEQDRAVSSADEFVEAVHAGDGVAACARLAPATVEELEQSSGAACAEVVLDEAVEAGGRVDASTYGSMSQVRYADDVLFLAEFDDGWRVVAASCQARRGGPYDCAIQGR